MNSSIANKIDAALQESKENECVSLDKKGITDA